MLALNNLCLQYVEVTFYQVARSLTILFNIFFTYTMLGTATSAPAMVACGIVFAGFIIGSYGEINFSWAGIVYGVGSSLFVALYGIYVKKTLAVVDNNQWWVWFANIRPRKVVKTSRFAHTSGSSTKTGDCCTTTPHSPLCSSPLSSSLPARLATFSPTSTFSEASPSGPS